jgi:hypothetical protein
MDKGRGGIVEAGHGLGALGDDRGHQIAQKRGLAGPGRAVDPQNATLQELLERQIDGRLLQEGQRVPPSAGPARRRCDPRRYRGVERLPVPQQVPRPQWRPLSQVELQVGRGAAFRKHAPRRGEVPEEKTVQKERLGGVGALEGWIDADGEVRRRGQLPRQAEVRQEPFIGPRDRLPVQNGLGLIILVAFAVLTAAEDFVQLSGDRLLLCAPRGEGGQFAPKKHAARPRRSWRAPRPASRPDGLPG